MSKLYLLPVSIFVLLQVASIGSYAAAVLQGHVPPLAPYISDAGTYPPESCVFGQLLNMAAVLMGFLVYVRYQQVLVMYDYHPEIGDSLLKKNKLGLWFGMAAAFGISIVANFQLDNVPIVHFMGAFTCFFCSIVYLWIQTCLSYILQPMAGTKLRAHLRLAMSISCTILYIGLTVTGIIARFQFTGENLRKWQSSDGGWFLHVFSSVSEWVLSAIFCIFILTFTDEFQDVYMEAPQVTLARYTS